VAGKNNKPGGKAQGPSAAEIGLIRGTAVELRTALPALTEDDAAHYAMEAVKEQGLFSAAIHQIATSKDARLAWIELTVFKPPSNIIDIDQQSETIAVFAGPTRPTKDHSDRQIVGAAMARAVCTSVYARALLYARGMRCKLAVVPAPVRSV